MNEIVKELRNEFNKRKNDLQEPNIKVHIVTNTFLKYLGYDSYECIYEVPTGKGYCDILVPINGDNALVVEVKTGKQPLNEKDIEQIQDYANRKKQRFGILTNGYEYILLDFKISSPPILKGTAYKSYVVFWFNIFRSRGNGLTELKYFKYLSFENLFKKQSTLFYCDIAQYREWKLEQNMKPVSWNTYRCTLFQFFDFYSNKVLYKEPCEKQDKIAYETLGMNSIKEFLKDKKRNPENISIETINNNCTHIYNMLYELKKHGKINHICLDDSRKQNLIEYSELEQKKQYKVITTEDVESIIEFLKHQRNATRNIALFLLTVTLGLERSQLLNLTWDDFDRNFKHILIDGRKIELCFLLQKYLMQLHKEKSNKKLKCPNVFQLYYNKKHKPMREWNVNDVFDNFSKITNDEKWKSYSPKYVRSCLIKTLFSSGYSIDDIICITGIDIKNLANLIDTQEIICRKTNNVNWNQLYDGVLCANSIMA